MRSSYNQSINQSIHDRKHTIKDSLYDIKESTKTIIYNKWLYVIFMKVKIYIYILTLNNDSNVQALSASCTNCGGTNVRNNTPKSRPPYMTNHRHIIDIITLFIKTRYSICQNLTKCNQSNQPLPWESRLSLHFLAQQA